MGPPPATTPYIDAPKDARLVALLEEVAQGVDAEMLFVSAAPALRRQGLLPPDYAEGKDYLPYSTLNDGKVARTTRTAKFPNLKAGLRAHAALLASARANFERDAEALYRREAPAPLTDNRSLRFNATKRTATYAFFRKAGIFAPPHAPK